MENKGFLELLAEADGEYENYFSARNASRVTEADIDKVIDLVTNRSRWPVHRQTYLLREALTTSDFPLALGTVLDRTLLAAYRVAAPDWRTYMRSGTRRDFQTAEIFKTWGAENTLLEVKERGEFLSSKISEGKYTMKLKKYGRSMDVSWEMLLSDPLGYFNTIPGRFARAALRTEWRVATGLMALSTGPNTALYGAPIVDIDGVSVTNKGVLALTIANLQTTLNLMAAQVDADLEPIEVEGIHLVVPTALWLTAREIVTSTFKQVAAAGVTDATFVIPTANILSNLPITVHRNKYLSIIDTTKGTTTWYMFADPADGPAAELDFLIGHEAPEICMKAPDKVSVGGGAISQFEGDFHSDNVKYRVRHAVGGVQLDPRYTYSNVP